MKKQCETALTHSKAFPSTNGSLTRAGARFHKKLKFSKHGFPSKIESKITFETQILWDPPTPSRSAARDLYVDNLYVFGVCCQYWIWYSIGFGIRLDVVFDWMWDSIDHWIWYSIGCDTRLDVVFQ